MDMDITIATKNVFTKFVLLAILLLLNTVGLNAQSNISTTTCPGAGCVDFNVAQQGSIGIQVTGTWVGTLTFKGSVKGGVGASTTEFVDLAVIPSNSSTPVTTTTSNGSWSRNIAGYTTVRVQFTAYTSGTAVVSYRTVLPSGLVLSEAASGAPDSATFITQTLNASLSNEQAIASLSSGLLRGAATTGVITSITTSAGVASNISDETGTGFLAFATAPTFTTSISIGSAGVRISDDGDGAITFLGLGDGSDEDLNLNLDDTSNVAVITSSTGVTQLRASVMQMNILSILLEPVLFAALGTPTDGTIIYCSDCGIANPCAGAGTGAIAKRLNGVWVCN